MSVSTDPFYIAYTGDGASVNFTFPDFYINQADLLVTLALSGGQPVTQTLGVHYTVTDVPIDGMRPNGGTVHFLAAPANASTIVICRRTRRDQETVYAENDPFPAKAHEHALDKLSLLVQEIMRGYQGVCDGPPSGGTRWDGAAYREGDWYYKRRVALGDVMGYIYVEDGAGGFVWAQFGQISMISGVL